MCGEFIMQGSGSVKVRGAGFLFGYHVEFDGNFKLYVTLNMGNGEETRLIGEYTSITRKQAYNAARRYVAAYYSKI